MPLWYVYIAGFMVLDCGKFLFFQFLSLCESFIFCIKTLGFFFKKKINIFHGIELKLKLNVNGIWNGLEL